MDGTVTFESIMSSHHKQFGIVEQDIEHRCEAGGEYTSKGTVSIPYSDEHYFLIAIGPMKEMKMELQCRGHASHAYIGIYLGILCIIIL